MDKKVILFGSRVDYLGGGGVGGWKKRPAQATAVILFGSRLDYLGGFWKKRPAACNYKRYKLLKVPVERNK